MLVGAGWMRPLPTAKGGPGKDIPEGRIAIARGGAGTGRGLEDTRPLLLHGY